MKRSSRLLPAVAVAAFAASAGPTHACSDSSYMADICFMAGDYCPRGHDFADGTILTISSNPSLFSLLGTAYGGDGRTTFALPDLRGRSPVSLGETPYSSVALGTKRGESDIQLTEDQLPPHDHGITLSDLTPQATLKANHTSGGQSLTAGGYPGVGQAAQSPPYAIAPTPDTTMASVPVMGTFTSSSPGDVETTGQTGGGRAFVGTAPRLGLTACIRTSGLYPPRE